MNREIKYKLWDTEKKLMLNCYEIIFVQGGIRASDGCTTQGWVKVNKGFEHLKATLILREFTGLKDKNGKDIYEGDIIKYGSENYEVMYNAGIASFTVKFDKENAKCYPSLNIGTMKHAEVIGNIYEDPDLLEADK